MPDPQLLRMMQIDFVGFVEEGANQEDGEGAYIKIWKRAEPGGDMKDVKKGALADALNRRIESMDDARGDIVARIATAAGIAADTVNAILDGSIEVPPDQRLRGFARVLGLSFGTLEGLADAAKSHKEEHDMFDPKDLDEDARKAFAALEEAKKAADLAATTAHDEITEATKKLEKAEADLVEAQKGGEKDPEKDVLKGLPEEVQKALDARQAKSDEAIAKAQEQADAATKAAEVATEVAKVEREKRERKEFANIAKNDMGDLTTENLGDQLYEARQLMSDEAFEAHTTMLKAASAQAKTVRLFEESGATASGTIGGAWEEVEALAKVMVDKKLAPTKEQAIAKVYEEHPELYDRYVSEQADA